MTAALTDAQARLLRRLAHAHPQFVPISRVDPRTLRALRGHGYVDGWRITADGLRAAERLERKENP